MRSWESKAPLLSGVQSSMGLGGCHDAAENLIVFESTAHKLPDGVRHAHDMNFFIDAVGRIKPV